MNRRVVVKTVPTQVSNEKPAKTKRPPIRAWREQHFYSFFSSLGRLAARPWATTLTLAVLSLALAFPLLFWLLLDNAKGFSGNIDDARSISVFLKPTVDASAAKSIADKLRTRSDIAQVVLKSPEQGLEEFRSQSGFADALKVLHYNPLPAVLIVNPRAATADSDPSAALVAELERDPAVDLVQYDAQWRQRLNAILLLARRGAAVLAVLLALAALLVVGNTVRLDIQSRADEIAVMQMLGADNGFVRRPFLYIGFWYGALAGVVSLILIGIVEWALAAPLASLTSSYDHRFDVHGMPSATMGLVLLGSALLGWFGAWIAASRHIALGTTDLMEATLTRHITSETPRVMVVDGSKVVRRLIEQLLKADLPGVTVLACETGEEAKRHLEEGVVDLITTALRLPDMDGLDLAKYVREHAPQAYIPIVIVSGDVNERLINRELSEFVTDYFDKSLGFHALTSFIRGYIQPESHVTGDVLYVEDSRVVALATRRMLEKYGLNVQHVTSVEDAVALLETAMAQGKVPGCDVVLSDVNLKGELTGGDLLDRLRNDFGYSKGELPVLIMTGDDNPRNQAELLRAGANDLVQKPIEERLLITKLLFQMRVSQHLRKRARAA